MEHYIYVISKYYIYILLIAYLELQSILYTICYFQ